jgi:hypothetical protein
MKINQASAAVALKCIRFLVPTTRLGNKDMLGEGIW